MSYIALAANRPRPFFPVEERFGICQQIRRAAVSVPANIAEACGRSAGRDQARFLDVACGSVSELEALFELSQDLGYVESGLFEDVTRQCRSIARELAAARAALRRMP